jgi:shikimate 5-dehydrogenase
MSEVFMAMTVETLRPAELPTLYFIGVTTARSSIQKVFPLWVKELGLGDVRLKGIDLSLHASPEDYRRVVKFIAGDPLSLGALVTTHKIDLFRATRDQFDVKDKLSQLMGETSCISKTQEGLVCHAKDPFSSGLALGSFIQTGYWQDSGAEVLAIGAGGSAIAISWYLSQPSRLTDRPSRIITSNRSQPRLDHLREIHRDFKSDTVFNYTLAPNPADNDAIVASLVPGSLVINATGLGKDATGSPLTNSVRFPDQGLAWELNYRGELVFLEQARSQVGTTLKHVEDGWVYFLHGWIQVIGEVFHIDIPTRGASFERLSELAKSAK